MTNTVFRVFVTSLALVISSTGLAWETLIDGTANTWDRAFDITVDASGDAYLTGEIWDIGDERDFSVVKVSGNSGSIDWVTEYSGFAGAVYRPPAAIELDSSGAVIAVGGFSSAPGTGPDFFAASFDTNFGAGLWTQAITTTGFPADDGGAYSLAVLPDDDVVAVGSTPFNGHLAQGTAVRLDRDTGAVEWAYHLRGEGIFAQGFIYDAAITPDGDVIIVGLYVDREISGPTAFGLSVARLDGALGSEMWRQDFPDPVCCGTRTYSVAVDQWGDVVIGGKLAGQWLVMKLDGLSGAVPELWTASGDGRVRKIALDANGDVFAVGSFSNAPAAGDASVAKFSGTDGTLLWKNGPVGGGFALDLAIAPNGDVAIVDDVIQIIISRFDGANGDLLWQADVGLVSQNTSIAVDQAGDVLAAGTQNNDFAVLKLNGDDGSDFLVDMDGDGIVDDDDNCPNTPNPDQTDTDEDGTGDACDADDDNDGIDDGDDNCPFVANPGQSDIDSDGIGDACDDDLDGDGVPNGSDNCTTIYNPPQIQTGNNVGGSFGDACVDPGVVIPECVEVGSGTVIEAGVTLKQCASIGSNVFIGAGATIKADAELGDGVVIGANATIKEGAVIGDGSMIGKRSTIKAGAMLGANVIVGDDSVVWENASIGDNSEIGHGSTVKNDAVVGSEVIIGDNTVIDRGVEIGDGAVIGNDATIKADVPPGVVIPDGMTFR